VTSTNPYKPPRAPIDKPPREDPPTVGYLIGGLIQLCAGATCIVFALANGAPASAIWGLFIGFFGLRAVIKYRARTGHARGNGGTGRKPPA
jgi:hypothetical protein